LSVAGPLLQVLLLASAQGIEQLLGLGGRQAHGLEALTLSLQL
jgi:hypothetical protein